MALYDDYKAGQMAGPNGLTFVVDTHGWPGDVLSFKAKQIGNLRKKFNIFFKYFFHGQRRDLQLIGNSDQFRPIPHL